jgi:hypothetical protein
MLFSYMIENAIFILDILCSNTHQTPDILVDPVYSQNAIISLSLFLYEILHVVSLEQGLNHVAV